MGLAEIVTNQPAPRESRAGEADGEVTSVQALLPGSQPGLQLFPISWQPGRQLCCLALLLTFGNAPHAPTKRQRKNLKEEGARSWDSAGDSQSPSKMEIVYDRVTSQPQPLARAASREREELGGGWGNPC